MSEETHRKIAKVLVGDMEFVQIQAEAFPDGAVNVVTPAIRVRIITVNGEIWVGIIPTFVPEVAEELAIKMWDQKDGYKNFTRMVNL